MFSQLRCLSCLVAFFSIFPSMAMAAAPGAQFNGKVSEIFVNDGSILIAVTGNVNGACSGTFGSYNLTFDITDPGAQFKFELIKSAFLQSKNISGYVQGCGSSNINKLIQISSF
ncbi:MAG: hypothetical protein V7L25_02190 [Nostoc sp.]|uniref:hypothetical protein n=1 Tax=Nostoc sp. TaxID=1180 RepID=UPI002FEEC497